MEITYIMLINITFNIKGGAELSQFHPFLHLVDKSETGYSSCRNSRKCNKLHFPYPAYKKSKFATLMS